MGKQPRAYAMALKFGFDPELPEMRDTVLEIERRIVRVATEKQHDGPNKLALGFGDPTLALFDPPHRRFDVLIGGGEVEASPSEPCISAVEKLRQRLERVVVAKLPNRDRRQATTRERRAVLLP